MRSRLVVALQVGVLVLTACGRAPDPGPSATAEARIRYVIDGNLHFSLHCWCRAADPSTVQAVRAALSEKDLPALVKLLEDPSEPVADAAVGTLVTFGSSAVPLLDAASRGPDPARGRATRALSLIRAGKGNPA